MTIDRIVCLSTLPNMVNMGVSPLDFPFSYWLFKNHKILLASN